LLSSSALASDISAGNEEVGETITDAIQKVSENGVITIEESKTMKTEIDVVEGMMVISVEEVIITTAQTSICGR